jgi:hypothetical protein
MSKFFIQKAIKHVGQLHRDLGIKQGQKIPLKTLMNAAKGNSVTARRARLALTLRRMK